MKRCSVAIPHEEQDRAIQTLIVISRERLAKEKEENLKPIPRLLECPPKSIFFNDELTPQRHKLLIKKQRFQCFICHGMLSSLNYLTIHVERCLEAQFKCRQCSKRFNNIGDLQIHARRHFYRFKCEQCGKRFKYKNVRDAHYGIHSDARPFECKLCNKAYKYKSQLWGHVNYGKTCGK